MRTQFGDVVPIEYKATPGTTSIIRIYRPKGFHPQAELIRVLTPTPQTKGINIAYWDGLNTHGEPVTLGVYYYTVQVGNTISPLKAITVRFKTTPRPPRAPNSREQIVARKAPYIQSLNTPTTEYTPPPGGETPSVQYTSSTSSEYTPSPGGTTPPVEYTPLPTGATPTLIEQQVIAEEEEKKKMQPWIWVAIAFLAVFVLSD